MISILDITVNDGILRNYVSYELSRIGLAGAWARTLYPDSIPLPWRLELQMKTLVSGFLGCPHCEVGGSRDVASLYQ